MVIELLLPENALRTWHAILVDAIRTRGDHVVVRWQQGNTNPLPAGLAALLMLEDTIFGQRARSMTAPASAAEFGPLYTTGQAADIAIDLTPAGTLIGAADIAGTWRLTWDGHQDESTFWSALLDGRAPHLQLIDGHGQCRGHALPAIENPQRLGTSADQVFARIISLIIAGIAGASSAMATPPPQTSPADGTRTPLGFLTAALTEKIARRVKKLTGREARWRVGYRAINSAAQRTIESLQWPQAPYEALADDGQRYYADPFPVTHEGRQFLFVEEFPYATGKGILSVAEIGADGRMMPPRPCLETPAHLSYPQVFRHENHYFMIPESCAANRVDLYRASSFPLQWEFAATLIADTPVSDCTIFCHDNRWWMLGTVSEFGGSTWDCLHAWSADDLAGPWHPHPKNPLLIDASCARPAGAVVRHEGRLLRPVQNCVGGYGAGLGIAEITRLDETDFQQTVLKQLAPDPRWRARGVHTLNDNGLIEAIDYFA